MTQYALINGKIIRNQTIEQKVIIISNGIIEAVKDELPESFEGEVIDVANQYVCPGLIDIHTHGAFGVDINRATVEDFVHYSKKLPSQGATAGLVSIVTDEIENITRCIECYNTFRSLETSGTDLVGIHLEGPYLSHEYRGSMPEHLLIPYQPELIDQLQTLAQGQIKMITIAPEVEGVSEHIRHLKSLGMKVSVGHSAATYDETQQAFELGADGCTHTFNAMRLFHQHEPGVMGAVLESDHVYCEAICDGRHLHPGTVRMLLKTVGYERVIAITDSIMAAGLGDGEFYLGVNKIIVTDGDAKLASADVRAGSTLTMIQALRNLIKFTQEPLEKVIALLTENPAKYLNIYDQMGSIDEGKHANLIVLSPDYELEQTIIKGELAYQK